MGHRWLFRKRSWIFHPSRVFEKYSCSVNSNEVPHYYRIRYTFLFALRDIIGARIIDKRYLRSQLICCDTESEESFAQWPRNFCAKIHIGNRGTQHVPRKFINRFVVTHARVLLFIAFVLIFGNRGSSSFKNFEASRYLQWVPVRSRFLWCAHYTLCRLAEADVLGPTTTFLRRTNRKCFESWIYWKNDCN